MPERILSRQINKERQNLRMGYLELGRSKLSQHFLLLLVQSVLFAKEGKTRFLGSKILFSLTLHVKHMTSNVSNVRFFDRHSSQKQKHLRRSQGLGEYPMFRKMTLKYEVPRETIPPNLW